MAHLIQIVGDLGGDRALLFAGGGDLGTHLQYRIAVVAQLLDIEPHLADELLAAGGAPYSLFHDLVQRAGTGLQLFDHLLDLHRRLLGTAGECTHLISYHRKAATLLTGTGRFDGGVQGQQVGLLGDGVDDVDHFIDPVGVVGEPLDRAGGVANLVGQGADRLDGAGYPVGAIGRLFARLAGLLQGVVGITRHFADRCRHLFHGGGQ